MRGRSLTTGRPDGQIRSAVEKQMIRANKHRVNVVGRVYDPNIVNTLGNESSTRGVATNASWAGGNFILSLPIEVEAGSLVVRLPGKGAWATGSVTTSNRYTGESTVPNTVSWQVALEIPTGITGTVTTAGTSTFSDSTKAWQTNELAQNQYIVRLYGGTAVASGNRGWWSKVTSNTGTQITVATAAAETIEVGQTYELMQVVPVQFGGDRICTFRYGQGCPSYADSDPVPVMVKPGIGSGYMFIRMFVQPEAAGGMYPAGASFKSGSSDASWLRGTVRDQSDYGVNTTSGTTVCLVDSMDCGDAGWGTLSQMNTAPASTIQMPAPLAILGVPVSDAVPYVVALGASHTADYFRYDNMSTHNCYVGRAGVTNGFATCVIGRGSEQGAYAMGRAGDMRRSLAQEADWVWLRHGYNDITASLSVAEIVKRLKVEADNVRALGAKVVISTLPPSVTYTGGNPTTPGTQNAQHAASLLAFNEWVRGKSTQGGYTVKDVADHVIEVAQLVDNGYQSNGVEDGKYWILPDALIGTFTAGTSSVSDTTLSFCAASSHGDLGTEGDWKEYILEPVTSRTVTTGVFKAISAIRKYGYNGNYVNTIALTEAITPTVYTIADATNASPIVVETSAAHALQDGDNIIIGSVGGNTNANGTYFVKTTGYDTTHFALYTDSALTSARAGNAAYTSGGTATASFQPGDTVRVWKVLCQDGIHLTPEGQRYVANALDWSWVTKTRLT